MFEQHVINDMINGGLELIGAIFTLSNCYVLLKDKVVKGINPFATVFFALWGIWNIFWYSSLGQPFSYYGGMCITFANITWISILIYYKIKNDKTKFS